MTSRPKLMLAKSTYREAKRPDGTPGFAMGRGRGRGNMEATLGTSLLGLGREHSGIMSAAPPSAGQFEPANEKDDNDDSDEEIVMLKPSVASGASGHSFSVPSADMPAPKSDSAEHPNESAQPKKKAEIKSVFSGAKPTKKKITLRLSSEDEGSSVTKVVIPAPTKPAPISAPPVGAWQKNAWQVPVPAKPQPPATDPTTALETPVKTSQERAPASAAEATHFFKLLTRASGGIEPPGLPGSSSKSNIINNSFQAESASAKPTSVAGSAVDPRAQLSPHEGEASLPVDAARNDILAALATHSVVVFKGDTGCGKSSRVPRFIVEGDPEAKVVVAQPRRLAAIALARRVAHERHEAVGGANGLVGYKVSHASKIGPQVRLTFATVGWLLQKLVHFVADGRAKDDVSSSSSSAQASLPFDYSVVVVDEVHERDLEMDLLLLVLRLILKKHSDAVLEGTLPRDSRPPFKLVCMSATFDANEFVRYFRPASVGHHPASGGAGGGAIGSGGVAPPLVVGGRRFPVNPTYLDDLLAHDFPYEHFPAALPTTSSRSSSHANPPCQKVATPPKPPAWLPLHEAEAARRFLAARPFRKCIASSAGNSRNSHSGGGGGGSSSMSASYGGNGDDKDEEGDEAAVPDAVVRLAARLVFEVCRRRPGEGVLVFLSGFTEIEALHEHLRDVALELTSTLSSGGSQKGLSSSSGGGSGALAALGVSVSVLHSMVDLGDQAATLDQANHQSATTSVATPDPTKLLLKQTTDKNQTRPTTMTQVVLATNLAESSLTMPSLRTVIDLGLHKELVQLTASSSSSSSPRSSSSWHRNATTLRKAWVSKASAQQRAGRAGRVAPGSVIRLYPRAFFEQDPDAGGMALFDAPEMSRLPLDRVVLRAKLLGVKSVHATLMGALVPPPCNQVDAAIQQLVELGALVRVPEQEAGSGEGEGGCAVAPSAHDDGCVVTALGRALGSLPLEFKAARLLLLGACLGCGAEALVLACLLSAPPHGDLFEPLPQADKASAGDAPSSSGAPQSKQGGRLVAGLRARRIFDRGLYSDPLASLEAFKQWLLFRHALKHKSAAAAATLVSSGAVGCEGDAVATGGRAGNAAGAQTAAAAAADVLVRTPARAEAAWCRAWGLSRQRLVELELRCADVAVRATALLPAAAHQLAVLLKDTASTYSSSSSSAGLSTVDAAAADARAARLHILGQDVPTLQLLLLFAALPGGGSSLIRADRKLAPPRLLARFPHQEGEVAAATSSTASEKASGTNPSTAAAPAAAPMGARLALLAGVVFQPLDSGPTTIAAAASLLRAALESWCGPLNRLEFVPPEGHDPTVPRALAGAQLLAAGRWIVEFPATPLDQESTCSNSSSSCSNGNQETASSLNAVAMAAVEGHSGGLRDLALCDIPLGLKALAHLSLAPRGLRLPVPSTTHAPPSSSAQAPTAKGKSGKSRKGQGKDGGKSGGGTGTSSSGAGSGNSGDEHLEASVFVSSVRWSFSTQWHLPILAAAPARNSSGHNHSRSRSGDHGAPYVVPARGSSLCFAVNASRSGHKNPGYALCGEMQMSSSSPGAIPMASGCTALPHDSAALAAALLLLAPPTATLVLSPPPPSTAGSNGADGPQLPSPGEQSFQGGRLGYLVPRRSHSGYKLREVHHWKGALTVHDLEMVNAIRSRLSEALGAGPGPSSSFSTSSSPANDEGDAASTDMAFRPLDGRHDPSLTVALHAALRHLATKLKAPTGSSGSNSGSSADTPTAFVAFGGPRSSPSACLPGWRCLDLHHHASHASTFPGCYSTAHVPEEAMQAAAGIGERGHHQSSSSTTTGVHELSDQFLLSGAEIEAGVLATAVSPSKMHHNMEESDYGAGEVAEDNNEEDHEEEEEEEDKNWEDDFGDEFLGVGEGGVAVSASWVQPPSPGLDQNIESIRSGLQGMLLDAGGSISGNSSAAKPLTSEPKGEFDLMRALGLMPPPDEEANDDDDTEEQGQAVGGGVGWSTFQGNDHTGGGSASHQSNKSAPPVPSVGEEQLMRDFGLLPSGAASVFSAASASSAAPAAFASAPALPAAAAAPPMPPPTTTSAPATASAAPPSVNSAALAMLFDSAAAPPSSKPPAAVTKSRVDSSTSVTLATLFGAPPPPSPPAMAAAGNYSGAMFDLSDLEGGDDGANMVDLAELEGGIEDEEHVGYPEMNPDTTHVSTVQRQQTDTSNTNLDANAVWSAAFFS